ncbi:MAG TPA: CvpA family protein [Bacteroidetes bacterium]|nr:CvpA family protein [Bacteroidota bacterium]
MSINLLDILLLIPLLWFGYNGYKKGLIIEVASLAAFILGLYFAFYFSDFTAGYLKQYFEIQPQYMAAVSFIVTFVGVIIIVLALAKLLEKFINILMLGFLNKLGGAVFGILKGALFLSILIFIINYFDTGRSIIKPQAARQSIFYEPVESLAPMLYSKLHLDHFKEQIPDKDELLKKVI